MLIYVDPKILLSRFIEDDVPALVSGMQIPEVHDSVANLPNPYTEKEAAYWLEYADRAAREAGRLTQWAVRETESGKLIGGIGFTSILSPDAAEGDFGYWLHRDYWGKGYMTRVVRGFTRAMFDYYELLRLQARVYPENAASERVLEKCGYRFVERRAANVPDHGQLRDVDVFMRTVWDELTEEILPAVDSERAPLVMPPEG